MRNNLQFWLHSNSQFDFSFNHSFFYTIHARFTIHVRGTWLSLPSTSSPKFNNGFFFIYMKRMHSVLLRHVLANQSTTIFASLDKCWNLMVEFYRHSSFIFRIRVISGASSEISSSTSVAILLSHSTVTLEEFISRAISKPWRFGHNSVTCAEPLPICYPRIQSKLISQVSKHPFGQFHPKELRWAAGGNHV